METRRKDTLLLIGSEGSDRSSLHSIFAEDFKLLEAESISQGIFLLEENARYIAAVLVDMPLGDGDEMRMLTAACQENGDMEIPVLSLITPKSTGENEEFAFILGATDVVKKPYTPMTVQRRVQILADMYAQKWQLENLVQEQNEEIRQSSQTMLDALSSVIEYRSAESGNHIPRVRAFTRIILLGLADSCPEYGLDGRIIDMITSAAALHDIGKVSVPDTVLHKADQLTPEEYEIIKSHTRIGAQLVAGLKGIEDAEFLRYVYNVALSHHERWDGAGYPEGLAGDAIPICAQAVGLADAFDALISRRSYKPAFACDGAVNMILNGECGAFSPKLLECLKRVRGKLMEAAKQYADGASVLDSRIRKPLPGPEQKVYDMDSRQMSQMKYRALMQVQGDTIIEMDVDNRIYHIANNPNPDLVSLLTDTDYDNLLERVLRDGVHPEDREAAGKETEAGFARLFGSSCYKHSFRCRLFSPPHGAYRPYEITMQRILTGNPQQRMMLVVCHDLYRDECLPDRPRKITPAEDPLMYDLNDVPLYCQNDDTLTILDGGGALLQLTGYTQGDIHEQFADSFGAMVAAEDQAAFRAQMKSQQIRSGKVEFDFRLRRKNAAPMWVQCRARAYTGRDGTQYCCMTLADISRLKLRQLELEETIARNEVILDRTENIVFEWDLRTDELLCSDKWDQRFGYELRGRSFTWLMGEENHVHPDDLPQLREKMQALRGGKLSEGMDVRIVNSQGSYCWSRVRAHTILGPDGVPSHVVGIIYDIDSLKTEALSMRQQAQRDELTKLLNKVSTQQQIADYLAQREEGSMAALVMLDLDNFKTVNDSLGHYYGDAVLAQMGSTLRSLFRAQDVVGRIGGDEFMILLKDIPSQTVAQDRCQLLVDTFREQLGQLMPQLPVSVSVGAALVPAHGLSFTELYRSADEALYTAKRRGKNQFKIFSTRDRLTAAEPGVTITRIDSDHEPVLQEDAVMKYIFQSLYDSRNVPQTIQELLGLVGMQFNVSRVYIFENSPDNASCNNTFEWCNVGISPEIENLQNLSYQEDLPGYLELYREKQIVYCTDIYELPESVQAVVEPQGIQSLLHCAIMDRGVFRGFVGFDECTAKCLWTQEQVSILQSVAGVISVFLTKLRLTQQLE